jgi:hypothetical protein
MGNHWEKLYSPQTLVGSWWTRGTIARQLQS